MFVVGFVLLLFFFGRGGVGGGGGGWAFLCVFVFVNNDSIQL